MAKTFQRRALACLGAIVLGLAGGPAIVRAQDLSGVVVSVEVGGKKIVVMDQTTSQPRNVTFVDQADIRTTTGQPLQFQNLKRGDRVGIVSNGGLATRVVVNQAPLRGVVGNIDLRTQKLMVTEDVTNRDIEVDLTPATRIESITREPVVLKDIKTGDGINVVYAGATPVAVTINSKPPELKGHIKSIGADMRSLIVTELGTNADLTVAVTPQTNIVSSTGKTLKMSDLQKGDGVGIAHQASTASLIVVSPGIRP
jgi:hypothetical protein